MKGDGIDDDILDTSDSGSACGCAAQIGEALVSVSTPSGYARNDLLAHSTTPASIQSCHDALRLAYSGTTVLAATPLGPLLADPPATVDAALPSLPAFGVTTAAPNALASDCGKLDPPTVQRGGCALVETGCNPAIALAGQFCQARNFAIDMGEQVIAAMPGTTIDMVRSKCAAFRPAMAAQVAELSTRPMEQVVPEVAAFPPTIAMAPDRLRDTATPCLSAGYASDDMDVTLGLAMLLVAIGSVPKAEHPGHHPNDGSGTARHPDLPRDWYDPAVGALKGGAVPMFAANRANRTDLPIRAAGRTPGKQAAAVSAAAQIRACRTSGHPESERLAASPGRLAGPARSS